MLRKSRKMETHKNDLCNYSARLVLTILSIFFFAYLSLTYFCCYFMY